MNDKPSFSTLRTSVSVAREPQVAQLAKKLRKAVERTVENIPKNDRHSRRFLPKTDLDQILTYKSLSLLFRELVSENPSSGVGDALQAITSDVADEKIGSHLTCPGDIIENCILATTGTPSRTSLLALFLYQDRSELLFLFLEWVTSGFNQSAAEPCHYIPSDKSMPFTETELRAYEVPERYHASILEEQAIFKPVTIRKLKYHRISSSERLPFVGRQESIKSGSQGHVVKATIAQSHWEIPEDGTQNHTNFVAGNPNGTKIVALKVFKAVEPERDMVKATRDFEIELDILKELRTSNTKHDMILLDWGSITELDETGIETSHALIFELASFSLGDFLKNKECAQEEVGPSRLLANLVDIIEALACLHDKLNTLHLDIKPDNILIFKKQVEGGSENEFELVWKLSDFGLARKKEAKQRAASAQTSTTTSRGSSLPATRPAGLYQAPEIQEQDTSYASRGSDVWSMGCVTLMVLAFGYAGPTEVDELERCLMVRFMDHGGREPLFYIRSDSYQWQHRTSHICHYLSNRDPDVGLIPRTAGPLRASLHSGLIDWSNILVEESYAFRKEQKFVIYILKVIVGNVLLIDRSERMGASALRGKLAYIQREWERFDLAPDKYVHPDALAELSFTRSRRSQGYETSPPGQSDESSPVRVPHVSTALPTAITDSRPTLRDRVEVTLHPIPSIESSVPDVPSKLHEPIQHQTGTPAPLVEREAPQDQRGLTPELIPQIQEQFCCAIEQNDATKVRLQLEQNPEMLGQLLPGAKRYPIHWALFNNAYQALDALLDKASLEITNLPWNGRTALDLALDSGKPAALDCIRKHRDKFAFPHELYDIRKRHLGSEAKRIAGDLFDINEAATPRQRSFFGLRRSRTSNAST